MQCTSFIRATTDIPTNGETGALYNAGGNFHGIGSPEGIVTASKGARYLDLTTPSEPVTYVKTTDNSNTGWI